MTREEKPVEYFKFTTAQAVAFIKRQPSGVRFALSVRLDAPVVDDPEHYFPAACSSYMNLSRPEASRLARSLLSETMEGRGARIPMRKTYDRLGAGATVWFG